RDALVQGANVGSGQFDGVVIESSSERVLLSGCVIRADDRPIAVKETAKEGTISGSQLRGRQGTYPAVALDTTVGRVAILSNSYTQGRSVFSGSTELVSEFGNASILTWDTP